MPVRQMRIVLMLAAGTLAIMEGGVSKHAFVETETLTASDAAANDRFGEAVGLFADTAIVGAKERDEGAVVEAGSAYVFERDAGGANNWGEVKKLNASELEADAQFGSAVAIWEDTVIVGAAQDDDPLAGSNAGTVYIFERDEGGASNWGLVRELVASDAAANAGFGAALALHGDTGVVGAPGDEPGGAVYVLGRDEGGPDNWGEVKKLVASDAESIDRFGNAVALYEDTVIAGSSSDQTAAGGFAGSAYVFERDHGGADNWGEVVKLTASDGESFARFGTSVALFGDTAIIGATGQDDPVAGIGAGAAYVFERQWNDANEDEMVQPGEITWNEVTKLTASDAAEGDAFGWTVALVGDTAIVGTIFDDSAAGSVYVYGRNHGGADNWGEVVKLTASDRADSDVFSDGLAFYGDTIMVGAPGNESSTGSTYAFERAKLGFFIAGGGLRTGPGWLVGQR